MPASGGGLLTSRSPTGASRPGVVELVGPAAAGKSSVLAALRQADGSWSNVRPRLHQYAASAIALGPTFLALHRPYRGILWREMKRIIFVRALQKVMQAPSPSDRSVVALDEGPIYMLARLEVYGGDRIRTPSFHRWWRSAIAQWATTLDLVVSLDAPDSVLIHRIRTRRQAHRARALPDARIAAFLGSYRRAYHHLLDALALQPRPRMLVFRTDRTTPAQIAEAVIAELAEARKNA